MSGRYSPPPPRQVVEMRARASGPAYASIGNAELRRAYLERVAAVRRTMPSRYCVNLDCTFTMPDGSVLEELAPVDLSVLHPGAAREALAVGLVIESLTWPAEPPQPWE